jgi:membrane protease YdiL (CAAX protease family)
MAKEKFRDLLTYIFSEAGFRPARQCYLNYRFALAMLAGIVVVWVMHGWVKPYPSEVQFSWFQLLSLIIWQPLVEEVLFRGIIQGQFAKREWGRTSWLGISGANLLASILFVAIHMVNSPPLFALTVIAPSLVFGYFRDYCNSVYPSIIIHSAYNAMVFVGLILYGNMSFPSF